VEAGGIASQSQSVTTVLPSISRLFVCLACWHVGGVSGIPSELYVLCVGVNPRNAQSISVLPPRLPIGCLILTIQINTI